MKRMIRTLALALVATVSFSAANAQKIQSWTWTASEDGKSVTIEGYVAGLGNITKTTTSINATFDYTLDASCENKNEHVITSFSCSGQGGGTFMIDQFQKNGRSHFSATIDMTQYLDEANCKKNLCPNGLVGGATYTISNLTVVSNKRK